MKSQLLEYSNENTLLKGYLVWDDTRSEKRPGIVVFPEAFGLNEHARQRADRLAELGYIAFAADMLGDGQVFNDMVKLAPAIQSLYADRHLWRTRAQAALDTLSAHPSVNTQKMACIGFCFGGATCFELARHGAELSAIVTFHAGIIPGQPEDAGRIRSKVLICHGAEDTVVKREILNAAISELRRDKVDWQFVELANAVHSFSDPNADERKMPGFAYNKLAEERSWAYMENLFDEVFL